MVDEIDGGVDSQEEIKETDYIERNQKYLSELEKKIKVCESVTLNITSVPQLFSCIKLNLLSKSETLHLISAFIKPLTQ